MTIDFIKAKLLNLHTLSQDALVVWSQLDSNTVSTVAVVVLALFVRWLIALWLEKQSALSREVVVRWKQRLRHAVMFLVIASILIIWAPQLRAFAVSIVAISAAIVVCFKEVINSLIGGVVRANVEGSRLGGRIMINGIRGDVVTNDILSTSMLEVNENGLRTGRMVVIPNSFFMIHATVTDFFMDRKYMLMWVAVPMKKEEDWKRTEEALLEIGQSICGPYIKDAIKYFERFNRKFGLNIPAPDPRVFIEWLEPEKIELKLRMAVPVAEQSIKRQEVFRHVLSLKTASEANEEKISSNNNP